MEGIYKINLIPNDLSVEETILQIADTLDNLNGIVDDVFTRITNKIQHNMDKTMKLKERIDVSRTKVEKLAGMQKAIKVFSSAKYPAAIVHEHYQSIFDKHSYHFEPKQVSLSGKSQRPSLEKGIQEKLHFFHVKVADPRNGRPKQEVDMKSVLEDVSSVGELLVFNTDESPYIRMPAKPAYVPRAAADVTKTVLDDPPPSIMKGNVLKREVDEYMYAPGMGMVPELDMPLDLPHLPGVAGDIQYSITEDGTIAPSAVTTPVAPIIPELPDLPELSDILPDVKPVVPDVTPSKVPDAPEVDLGKVPDVPDAPPLPPSMPIPPPPPPPPPPMDVTPVKTREDPPNVPSPGGDAHANLMAAIRQAGGVGRAKLRAADSPADKPSKPAIGGDLMADLHAKLSMRRRGISGAERAGGTVLHTLAAVIPETDTSPQQSSTDEDWD